MHLSLNLAARPLHFSKNTRIFTGECGQNKRKILKIPPLLNVGIITVEQIITPYHYHPIIQSPFVVSERGAHFSIPQMLTLPSDFIIVHHWDILAVCHVAITDKYNVFYEDGAQATST